MPQPDFKHKSWDATGWSLWGLLYTGADSDRALQTALTQSFSDAVDLLAQFGPQVEPTQSMVQEWKDEVASYGRTISFGEANDVLKRLKKLVIEIRAQLERDRQQAKSGTKPAPKKRRRRGRNTPKTPTHSPTQVDPVPDDDGPSAEDIEWAMRAANTMLGHSAATASSRPKVVKPKARPYVPPTPSELWRQEQRSMADRCDNGIGFGAHEVHQSSVLDRLDLDSNAGTVRQYRPGPEGGHVRILVTSRGAQYWTLGLTHRERRDAGNYSVYRRVGASSRFEFVSGRRHPKDPG